MQTAAIIQISMELWGAILCVMFASFIFIGESKKTKRAKLLLLLLFLFFAILVSDSAAWAYRGEPGITGYFAVRISNYLVFALNYAIGFTSLMYLQAILEENQIQMGLPIKAAVTGICALGFTMVTVSQFTGFLYTFDEHNLYHRAGGYLTICVVAGLMVIMLMLVSLYYTRKYALHQTIPMMTLYVIALLATAIQTLFYGISLVNLGMVVGVVLLFFAYERERIMVSSQMRTKLLENELRLAQQETVLAQKDAQMAAINMQLVEHRTQIMLSQIQPHFLYNALSAVSALCIRDPMRAKETIDNFALYLRANLNSLNNDHLIPFSQELQHTKAYLAIEQTRFGEDLAVVYDIQCEEFILPALTLQPMAENAVRHGICGSEDGGTVYIKTERRDGNVIITVKDDGVGFDPQVKPNDGRKHIGVENVMQRVRTLCSGTMVIDSAPGAGTTVTITLPDEQK